MIVVYASKSAVLAALLHKYEGVYWTVIFSSRTLKPNVFNDDMEEKIVSKLIRSLEIFNTMLVSCEITVLTRQ